jgi:type VI secretion system protein ImpH
VTPLPAAPSPFRRLAEQAPSFEFFQAVRLLLRERGVDGLRQRSPGKQALCFRANLSFQFKASDLQSIALPEAEGQPATLLVNFLGIASPGVIGSLPNWYAMTAIAEAADREAPNRAMAEFFALFDDRLIQLYFRAWLRNNLPIQYELGRRGVIARLLQSLVGFGLPAFAELCPLDLRAVVHHAAILLRRPATAAGLADSLQLWFGVPFAVEPFAELLAPLEREQRMRLGDRGTRLGETTVLGDVVHVRQGKFRLRAGPLAWREFVAFLPGAAAASDGAMLRELMLWVRHATGAEFEYDLQLVLREADVPKLAFRKDEPERARLGLSMWLGTRLSRGCAADTILPVSTLESRRTAERRRARGTAGARVWP